MANKVYSGVWHNTLAFNAVANIDFSLQSVGRNIKIKSVALTLDVFEPGMTRRYDWQTMLSFVRLTLASGSQSPTYPFTGLGYTYMGKNLEIYQPMQYFFDSFFIANQLDMNLFIVNCEGAGLTREFWTTVIIETEEETNIF
jgi:hypothetical protein